MCFQPRLHSHLIMLSNYISSTCIQLFFILSYKRILLGIDTCVWPILMWAKPNLNSLTHNRAWVKREQAGQSNLWLHRNISPFNRNIQTFKGRDTQGDSESDYKFCRKSLINLRKEILFQFVKEIQSRALRQRTRGPANCLIGGAGRILIGLSCPNRITNIFGSDCHYEALTCQGAV